MKIVYIGQFQIPSHFANSVQVVKMCDAMVAEGHTVTLVIPQDEISDENHAPLFQQYGVEHPFDIVRRTMGEGRLALYAYAWRAAQAARSLKPDLVYARCLPAALGCAMAGLPVVYEAHEPVYGNVAPRLFKALCRHKRLVRIVCISQKLADYFTKHGGVDPQRIVVAHDGADGRMLPHSLDYAPEGKPVEIGFVGQLYEGHGIQMLIDLAGEFENIPFHVIGGSGGLLDAWRRKIHSDNIHFYGHVPHAELAKWYQRCDILIAPYHASITMSGGGDKGQWMSPLKLFEYMAAGKAILCADLPVLREVLQHNHNAWLVPAQNYIAWQKALERLIRDRDLRIRLGHEARRHFEELYTWRQRVRRVLNRLNGRSENFERNSH